MTSRHRQCRFGIALSALLFLSACGESPSEAPRVEEAAAPDVADEPIWFATVEDLLNWTTPESRWLSNRRGQAMLALERTNPDLLITPVQGGRNSFEPAERYLITRLITDHIADVGDVTTADPRWVTRYFGFHQARYSTSDMLQLARLARADQIVALTANHDGNDKFSLTVTVRLMPQLNEIRTKTWTGLEFSDDAPPSIAVQRIIDDVADVVSGEKHRSPLATRVPDFDPAKLVFPQTVEELKSESQRSRLHEAAYLQLLAALHPFMTSNETRSEVLARSLVSLRGVSPESPYQRYFTARAHAHLDRRPAALAALGEPKTVHDRALLALLNGDLPALRKATGSMGDSSLDFMAIRDLRVLERRYAKEVERTTDERFAEQNPELAPFLLRALGDTNLWGNYTTLTIAVGLETLLPAEKMSVQNTFSQAAITGEAPGELELTRSLLKHVESFNTDQIRAWSASLPTAAGISELDIIDLATELAVANHLRRNKDDLLSRDLPESAVRRIREFEPLFLGHPEVTLQLGKALHEMSDDADGAERANLRKSAREAYRNGFSWTSQLTDDATHVAIAYRNYFEAYLPKVRRYSEETRDAHNQPLRYTEWPQKGSWFRSVSDWQKENGLLDRCIDYTWSIFSCATSRLEHGETDPDWSEADQQALLDKVAHRFIGSPDRSAFEIKMARDSGLPDAEIEQLRSRIAAGATEWSLYYALGREYKRRGDYKTAQETWLSYPGFSPEAGRFGVRESNSAYDAGSMLYWIGQHDLALPLFELAVSSRTGSDAELSSGARIALIHGDLETAAQWTAERIRRYQSQYAIRDMQQILHLLGESELAWGLFDQALSVEPVPQTWSGALVGHRIQGASIDDIAEWLSQSKGRASAQAHDSNFGMRLDLGQRYLLLAGTMDRVPGPDFVGKVASARVGDKPVYLTGTSGVFDRHGGRFEGKGHVRHHGRAVTHDPLAYPPGYDPKLKTDEEVETRYEMLAGAMTAFLNEDYESACRRFDATAYLYYLEEYLPYYAYCAAETGTGEHISALLEVREPKLREIRQKEKLGANELGYRFDEDLTYAVMAAFDGRHEAAISYLRAALNNRPYLEQRSVFPYYQVVDLAELLLRRFGHSGYRELALDLGRRHTVTVPMYSWAWFVVATHSESEGARIEAIATGLQLDPESHRLKQLPSDLVEKAKQTLKEDNSPIRLRGDADTPVDA